MRRPAVPFIVGSVVVVVVALPNNIIRTCHVAALSLPLRLQKTVARGLLVQPPGRPDVFVLGTVHVGSESAEEASLLIETVRPSTVVVEVAPSRLPLIRKRNEEMNSRSNEQKKNIAPVTFVPAASKQGASSAINIRSALRSLPALAEKGWVTGGAGGLIFAITILWGSLLKRSLTAGEELDTIPRADEFAAAIAAADDIGSNVIAPDMEIEELIGSIARSMNMPMDWISLGLNIAGESFGVKDSDPIRRRGGESLVKWAERRRNIATARASKAHGESAAPRISRVLVDERDAIFAESCCATAMRSSEEACAEGTYDNVTVCVVGLVHLDGVVERLKP